MRMRRDGLDMDHEWAHSIPPHKREVKSNNSIMIYKPSVLLSILLIAEAMVPISPFQTRWYDGCSDPGDHCIPHRVRDGLTIRQGQRCLIGTGINLAASACDL